MIENWSKKQKPVVIYYSILFNCINFVGRCCHGKKEK